MLKCNNLIIINKKNILTFPISSILDFFLLIIYIFSINNKDIKGINQTEKEEIDRIKKDAHFLFSWRNEVTSVTKFL